jgi:hypothetical protein
MMATTIMISTRVKPLRCLLQVFNILLRWLFVIAVHPRESAGA